jgi:Spy/CpxP family protein refolding chaperone
MKNLFLNLIAITTIIFSAKAQDNNAGKSENPTEQKREYRDKHKGFDHNQMAEKLKLTDEQKKQIKSINSDFKNQMQELNKDKNITSEELKEKKHALAKDRMERIQALLTPEQKLQMEEFKKEGKGKWKMDSGKRMEKLKSTLNLSDEQIEKMKAQKEIFKSKEETIKNNKSLTTDQKNEQLKSLRDEKKNSFKNLLTPEQIKKLEGMKHNRPAKTA